MPAVSPSPDKTLPFSVPDVPPAQAMDYAQARARFMTRLMIEGPAPEIAPPLGRPAGAQRVTYPGGPDGTIPLVAWVSDNTSSTDLKPAVLFLHGGNATGDGHWQLMKPYVDAGFVVMLPSFRGENGQAGFYSGFYNETSDALAAARYLETLPGVDRNRLFLAGHSNGGTLSILASMSVRSFKAAVPISAGVDAWRYFGHYQKEIRFDPRNQEEFIMRSSVCFAASIKCPTLLLRGTEERPFDRAHELTVERARAAGVTINHRLLPGTHNGVVPGAIAESIRFFKQYGA
ncbi:alpha/beta hydrolase family protein [Rhizobium helianthi]|uniref:Alpha/beta hydrolase family protein n=1 Tax=Rhizobium helianthi TaxID=1132695 RepID=A0ABW4M5B0_9HYPH